MARWLNKKGITCFVVRYRLVHILSDDPAKELAAGIEEKTYNRENDSLIPLAVADAASALTYVRTHATDFGINRNKIGILGFSAGGILAGTMAFKYEDGNRPDFVASIYAPVPPLQQNAMAPKDAPPLFLTAGSDDGEHLIPGVIVCYNKWQTAGNAAELHLYAKGGHGFGMNIQKLISDTWIYRFAEWLKQEGF